MTVPVAHAPLNSFEIIMSAEERRRDLYGWEAAMKHHCGVCFKKIKHTCIIKHMVLCPRFHAMLFIKGQQGSCKSCREIDREFERQVREIAKMLQKIANHHLPVDFPLPLPQPTEEEKPGGGDIKTPGSTKKERKFQKKIHKALTRRGEFLTVRELDSVAGALRSRSDENNEVDPRVVAENVDALKNPKTWEKDAQPAAEIQNLCARVLASLGIRCQDATESLEEVKLFQQLYSFLARTIASLEIEERGNKDREDAFQKIASRKRAEALQMQLQAKSGGRHAT